ncbi:xylose isomerase [Streptococcus moroccensis]|uniref:Xylose isomerase n=1 Tax=Streptococcus moroccensis TaxID=1451356 RepID=A0ABT9YPD6_9STRE|nr:xylose isomerase [Streptococcus moroccensis]
MTYFDAIPTITFEGKDSHNLYGIINYLTKIC